MCALVTGVQTCALPISTRSALTGTPMRPWRCRTLCQASGGHQKCGVTLHLVSGAYGETDHIPVAHQRFPGARFGPALRLTDRSDESRVGKEGVSTGSYRVWR